MDYRKQFFTIMTELCEKDKAIKVLVGDLGYSFMEEFAAKYPRQFINAGCAEQNMVGVAAGLALAGYKPYVYSGSIFLAMRAYEQIRDDVCYNKLDVKLVGTGASGFLGFTHNLEGSENEWDLLKNLPNLRVVYPLDSNDLRGQLTKPGAAYIRI